MVEREEADAETPKVRARILEAASRLIADGGLAALTTRAVAAAASVQAPTLYRLFGDKRGLLAAVAEHGLTAFFAQKTAPFADSDPLQTLREAWDRYVAFGLANPAVFAITNEVGAPAAGSPAMLAGLAILRSRVEGIARVGRLRLPVERAVALIHAAGVGTVTTLLALNEGARDPLLAPLVREAVLAAITADPPTRDDVGPRAMAIGLHAALGEDERLTPGERLLLDELLTRLAQPAAP